MLKFVKKFSMFILVTLAIVGLASCNNSGNKDVTVTIEGVQTSYTFNTGDEFSKDILLKDIRAIGSDGNDYSDKIIVSGLDRFKTENGKLVESGKGTVKIEVIIDGKTVTSKIIQVEVKYVAPETDDIIINGDFSTGSRDPFGYREENGGTGELSVVDGELKMTVTSLGWVNGGEAFPRAESNVFTLEDGKFYEYSFDIRANVETSVQVQIGELLSDAPFFNELLTKTYAVSTEMTTISYRFKTSATAGYDLTKLQILFGFGTHAGFESAATDVFMDNIKIVEVDSLGEDSEAPVITASDLIAYVGDDVKISATVKDNQDDNPTVTTDADTVIPQENGKYTTEGTYTVTITAKDSAGNESSKTIKVTVNAAISTGTNLISNGDFSSNTFDSNWVFYNKDWLTLTYNVVDGDLVVTLAGEPDGDNWGQQIKVEHLPLVEGKKYNINMTMNSSIDRKVQIIVQNDQWWNIHYENIIDLTAGTDTVINDTFEAIAAAPNVLLGIMLGNIEGNTYSAEHTLTIKSISFTLVDDDASETPTPKPDPTPGTDNTLPNGDENASFTNGGWIEWHDQNWCGSVVTLNEATLVDGVVTIDFTQTGSCWFGMQLFYTDKALEFVKYTIKVKINASVAGSVTINGNVVELKVGDNDIEVTAVLAAGKASFSMQFAVENGAAITAGRFVVSDLTFEKYVDSGTVNPDPEKPSPSTPTQLPDMVGLVANKSGDNVTIAWNTSNYGTAVVTGYKLTIKKGDTVIATVDNIVSGYALDVKDYEAGTYTVEVVALGDGTTSLDAKAGTATFVVETKTPVDPDQPTPDKPSVNAFTVRSMGISGSDNYLRIEWTDKAYTITKEPTIADCSVSSGAVVEVKDIIIGTVSLMIRIITGADTPRTVSVIVHTEAGDFKVSVTIEGSVDAMTPIDSTVEAVDCTHGETVNPDPDPEKPTPSTPTKLNAVIGLVANNVPGNADVRVIAWGAGSHPATTVFKLTVKDANGNKVVDNQVITNGGTIDVKDYAAGEYTVEVVACGDGTTTSDSDPATAKFTIEAKAPVNPTPDQPDTPVDSGDINFIEKNAYNGNHFAFVFNVEGITLDNTYTYKVTCADAGADAFIVECFQLVDSNRKINYFFGKGYEQGTTYVFTITITSQTGDVTYTGQVSVTA